MLIKKSFLLTITLSCSFSFNLENILNKALINNYKIKSYNHKIKAQDYYIKQTKSALYPSINLYSSLNYERYTEDYPNYKYSIPVKDKSKIYGISIKQVIFDKSIFPNVKNAYLKKEITHIEKESFILNLSQKVLSTYFTVLINKENLTYKKLKKENYLKILKEIEEKYKYNFATKTDVIQAKSNYASAINEYIKAKVSYENSIENLKILLLTTKPLNINGKIKDNIDDIIKNSIIITDKEKILNNPSLKEDKIYIKIAKNNINNNKAGNYPTVYLNSNYYNEIHNKTTSDKNHFKVSLNLNWNIYSGGKTENSIKEAKELLLSAINDFNYKKTTLQLDFNENWTNLQNNLEILKSDKEKIQKTKEYLLRAEESLKYKTISLTDFYIAQNNYYQSLIDFNNDKLNTIIYYIRLLADINEIKEKIKILDSFITN